MGDIEDFQADMRRWSFANFPDTPFGIAALGTSEEIGELAEIGAGILELVAQWGRASRAIVKGDQDIRGGKEKWLARLPQELADCFIKLCDVASRSDIDLELAIFQRWQTVRQRVAGSAAEAARGPEEPAPFTSGNNLVKCAVDHCQRMTSEDNPHFPFCGQPDADYAAQKETTRG